MQDIDCLSVCLFAGRSWICLPMLSTVRVSLASRPGLHSVVGGYLGWGITGGVCCPTVCRHENVDIVVIRENTEGEYSGLEHEVGAPPATAIQQSHPPHVRVSRVWWRVSRSSHGTSPDGLPSMHLIMPRDTIARE